jgi:hypothetical protein
LLRTHRILHPENSQRENQRPRYALRRLHHNPGPGTIAGFNACGTLASTPRVIPAPPPQNFPSRSRASPSIPDFRFPEGRQIHWQLAPNVNAFRECKADDAILQEFQDRANSVSTGGARGRGVPRARRVQRQRDGGVDQGGGGAREGPLRGEQGAGTAGAQAMNR